MADGPTIGVLSPSFGGTYFGGVLGGIARVVASAGGRIVAIQTLDAGTFGIDLGAPPPFRHHVAWDHVSGFVIILNAVNEEYVQAARASGRPIVMISDNVSDFDCPLVLPDNRGGVRDATVHLIDHGHTRIGFAGHPVQKDIRERYRAYRGTLIAHNLVPSPDLFFDTGNNQESGGHQAAAAMIEAGMPCTAVVAANDLNAIGLIRSLTAAGVELPQDQAVVGFDDTEDGSYLTPSLSSVKQPLEQIGGDAARLLLRQINGEQIEPGSHYVPTRLITRESCGCLSAPAPPLAAGSPERGGNHCECLVEQLEALLLGVEHLGVDRIHHLAGLTTSVDAVVAALDAAARGRSRPGAVPLRRELAALAGLLVDPQSLSETIRHIRNSGRRLQSELKPPGDLAGVHRVEDCIQEIALVLSQAQTQVHFAHSTSFIFTLRRQYAVSMELLRSHQHDPRSLEWLRRTDVRGGCLGLWPNRGSQLGRGAKLDVVGLFDRELDTTTSPKGQLAIRSFPPPDVVAMADLAVDDMLYVAHLKVESGDWGMLALVGPIEACVQTGRETMNQLAGLLSVALEHEAALHSVREQEERLRRASLYDELTGLPNRVFFRDRLAQAMVRTERRADFQYAVLLLDLDGFKLVNDSLGHLAGDRLLVQVAERISADLRAIDTAARFGGDEFAILLEEVRDGASTTSFAERLHIALCEPYDLGDQEVVVSASIGIALGSTGYGETEEVIRDADVAMSYAKSRQKGTNAVFDTAMHTLAVDRLRIEGELRRGIDANEFELHYQPIINLQTEQVSAAEALLRWRHPSRGLLAPADFLTIAEESGLTLPIGRWAFSEVCRELRSWNQGGHLRSPIRMNVNVSNRQFWNGQLIREVAESLAMSRLAPHDLVLEITEGVIMHDVPLARRMLDELHEMGVGLHIDDFGTGYSSLEALHDLPIDCLKIDRSFISRLGTNARSSELVRTIVLMGLNLELDVVAEGIETTAQLEEVRDLGCTYGQGYLFSRPVPGAEALAYIENSLPIMT